MQICICFKSHSKTMVQIQKEGHICGCSLETKPEVLALLHVKTSWESRRESQVQPSYLPEGGKMSLRELFCPRPHSLKRAVSGLERDPLINVLSMAAPYVYR